jgi:hypothetical protein
MHRKPIPRGPANSRGAVGAERATLARQFGGGYEGKIAISTSARPPKKQWIRGMKPPRRDCERSHRDGEQAGTNGADM